MRRSIQKRWSIGAAVFACTVALHAASSPPIPLLHAVPPGARIAAPDAVGEAERVTLDGEVAPLLLRLPEGTTLRIADWPVAPGVRRGVVLTRHEVYSPEARIWKVDGARTVEVPRSRLAFYWGAQEGDERAGVFVSVDPESGEVRSLIQSAAGVHDLRRANGAAARDYLVAKADSLLGRTASSSELPSWGCGEEGLPAIPRFTSGRRTSAAATAGASSLGTATVAIDTDNELLSLKFSNDTTSATNYVASLFAAMNVMYERDLQVRLLQGTTFLRVSTTADPYSQPTNGGATTDNLSEFTSYWSQNEGSVPRAIAAMLSGKQSTNNYSSGIAWIGGLCSSDLGYSYTQVFKIDHLAGDAQVVGHEIGHNFGSPHTHCYSPPIDGCWNGESGCYSGPASCPAPSTIGGVGNVQGTIMSYCNQLGGCTASLVFHPRTVDLVQPNIADA
ncbi:MAG TPA: M12 family metallo-peptidase, partial [Thermoanaerobaculia bacterium]